MVDNCKIVFIFLDSENFTTSKIYQYPRLRIFFKLHIPLYLFFYDNISYDIPIVTYSSICSVCNTTNLKRDFL